MDNTENKVQFNLKNTHYAVLTDTGYAKPVAIPGSVNLNLSPQGDATRFYADGLEYYVTTANNGYSGDLEIALVPLKMLEDVWGFKLDENGVLVEDATVEPKEFALLTQIDGDKTNSLYLLYRVTAQRPAIASATNESSKTPKTQTLSMTAVPRADGKVTARTTATTNEDVKKGWFASVYTGAAAEATQTTGTDSGNSGNS